MVYPPQFGSVAQSCPTLWTSWTAARQSSLSTTNSWRLPKFMSIETVMPSNHLILCHPLLILPSTFPSFGVFSNESALCNRWPKYWSFSFNISPSSEHAGLISFRIDWLEVLAVQGTLKSLLQHHSSKASILPCSALNITFSSVWSLSHVWLIMEKLFLFSLHLPYKNCFWAVVLEKTLESPLDCKENKPVNPKGNQSWIFIGRTNAEAEAPILWPPDVKNWFIRKDPDTGKDWRQDEKGMTEDEMVGWHHWLNRHEF